MVRKRLGEIFEKLDADCDGFICGEKISIKKIGTDVLEIFTPFFCQMEKEGLAYTKETFFVAGRLLLEVKFAFLG